MSYTYDGKNRLAGVNNNGEVQSSYAYRYDGLRFSKTVDGDTRYFTYNGGNITSELTSSGTYNYYRGLSLIGMTDPQKEKYYYTQNNKGDIIGLKDAAGNTVKTYKYDPFGNQNKDTEKLNFQGAWEQETSQVYNPFGYCGEYFDEETGFVYLRGRYYDPATERFITEDPMKDGGNWYTYCGNDPVNKIDPTGFKKTKVTVTLPGGTKINATVENGVTRLFDGSRPPAGSVVHAANGKDYVMTGSGQGKSPKDIARELAKGATLWDALGIKSPEIKQSGQPQTPFNRVPDFYVFNISVGGGAGESISYIVDRKGRRYNSIGGYAGVSPTLVSFSATAFWINTPRRYDKDDLHDYIMDWSGAYTAGAVIGTSVSKPKDLSLPEALGYGVLSPQAGISVGKTTDKFTNNTSLPVYTDPRSYLH